MEMYTGAAKTATVEKVPVRNFYYGDLKESCVNTILLN